MMQQRQLAEVRDQVVIAARSIAAARQATPAPVALAARAGR
jgi:hypothetical protein